MKTYRIYSITTAKVELFKAIKGVSLYQDAATNGMIHIHDETGLIAVLPPTVIVEIGETE